jgi:hypothetical protein
VDTKGNPVDDVPVSFEVTQGDGSFGRETTLTVNSDDNGRASAVLTLGPEEGLNNNVVNTSFPDLTGLPATFVASGVVPGQPEDTTVNGVVLDNSNISIPGATASIKGTGLDTTTDDQGQFTITEVPVGTVTLDLVTADFRADRLSVLLGNGDGTFFFGVGTLVEFRRPQSVVLADLDNDGLLDLVTQKFLGPPVTVRLGNGDGTFGAREIVSAGNNPGRPAVGDLDGDGILDLVMSNRLNNSISVLLGNGDGTFEAPQRYSAGERGSLGGGRALADLNGDGLLDLVASNVNQEVSVLLHQ